MKPPRAGQTITEALAAALWAFETTDHFREGALRAANLGGGSDVVAAAYGQLAGAHYGAAGHPGGLAHRADQPGLDRRLCRALLAHSQRR